MTYGEFLESVELFKNLTVVMGTDEFCLHPAPQNVP